MKAYIPALTKQLLAKCKKQGCNEVEAAAHLAAALLALTPPLMAQGARAASALLALTPAITAKGGRCAVRKLKLIYPRLCAGHTLLDHYIFYSPQTKTGETP
jgi:hypothetical protein